MDLTAKSPLKRGGILGKSLPEGKVRKVAAADIYPARKKSCTFLIVPGRAETRYFIGKLHC